MNFIFNVESELTLALLVTLLTMMVNKSSSSPSNLTTREPYNFSLTFSLRTVDVKTAGQSAVRVYTREIQRSCRPNYELNFSFVLLEQTQRQQFLERAVNCKRRRVKTSSITYKLLQHRQHITLLTDTIYSNCYSTNTERLA